jgi:hypothetical protein
MSGNERIMWAFLSARSMHDPSGYWRAVLDGLVWKVRP